MADNILIAIDPERTLQKTLRRRFTSAHILQFSASVNQHEQNCSDGNHCWHVIVDEPYIVWCCWCVKTVLAINPLRPSQSEPRRRAFGLP
jgi:hypothetical protein